MIYTIDLKKIKLILLLGGVKSVFCQKRVIKLFEPYNFDKLDIIFILKSKS